MSNDYKAKADSLRGLLSEMKGWKKEDLKKKKGVKDEPAEERKEPSEDEDGDRGDDIAILLGKLVKE